MDVYIITLASHYMYFNHLLISYNYSLNILHVHELTCIVNLLISYIYI